MVPWRLVPWKLVLWGVLLCALCLGLAGCEYVEAGSDKGSDSEFPAFRAVINEAERLDMEPGDYADRLYRSKKKAIEDRYERKLDNAAGDRLDRLENSRERELSELRFNYQDLCYALERRDHVCSEA